MNIKKHKNYLLCIAVLLTCACSCNPKNLLDHKDGPPHAWSTPELSKIKNAIPKKELPSPYGNPISYVVMGEQHHVLESNENYSAEGIASWYGRKFHGKRTSSGEPYDMHAMTAAHKNLPIPSYVHVKNLENGKEVLVKVNDRGPFADQRLIDLSYSAARKLGMHQKGTARVRVTSLSPTQYRTKEILAKIGKY
jgi:rare lipoprotein A